jgi:hypothetical protein
MSEPLGWEDIDDYAHLTGIEPLDKALAYEDPVPALREHLRRREREEGRAGVVADLEAIVASTPAGSPAHDGSAAWLRRYESGASADEL